jgi:beta-barrel assembly-enhancing protease
MKRMLVALSVLAALGAASPASAQIGSILNKAATAKQQLVISEADEIKIGTDVSAQLREKYGVVQDQAVHKYVTLVGSVLASQSSRPNLPWTFIVLDTDGINAFAAPGGFIHITRGALSILKNEAELADILGHEISHVTRKHAINAIQKSNAVGMAGDAAKVDLVKQLSDAVYKIVIEGSYNRSDEMDADKNGIALANASGYAPTGLGDFLTRLDARNKNQPDRNGLFASHPDMQARLDGLTKEIKTEKLAATAMVAARYAKNITYTPVPPPAGSDAPASSGGTLGLGGLSSLGKDKNSNQSVSSGGSRGVNTERDAKGGPNKAAVVVTVTAAEVQDFRKGIAG